MKKIIIALLTALLFASFAACTPTETSSGDNSTDSAVEVYADLVDLLRAELEALKSSQKASTADYEAKIAELERKIAVLTSENQQNSTQSPPQSTEKPNDEPETPSIPFTYIEKNGKITVTGITDDSITVLVVPEKIDGKPVVAIGDSAFAGSKLTGITLPSTVTDIGWFAFSGSVKLLNVTLPAGVESIGYEAFGNCPKLTVYCKSGSYAEQYAKSYGLSVVAS